MQKKLYRVEEGHMLAGVCGGVAEYFKLDPSFVRIGFAFVSLFAGSGILLYIVMWVIVPPKSRVS